MDVQVDDTERHLIKGEATPQSPFVDSRSGIIVRGLLSILGLSKSPPRDREISVRHPSAAHAMSPLKAAVCDERLKRMPAGPCDFLWPVAHKQT